MHLPIQLTVSKIIIYLAIHFWLQVHVREMCVLIFGRPFVKWFVLCYRSVVCLPCPVCLSVCDVCALWPNGWTDQDET